MYLSGEQNECLTAWYDFWGAIVMCLSGEQDEYLTAWYASLGAIIMYLDGEHLTTWYNSLGGYAPVGDLTTLYIIMCLSGEQENTRQLVCPFGVYTQ